MTAPRLEERWSSTGEYPQDRTSSASSACTRTCITGRNACWLSWSGRTHILWLPSFLAGNKTGQTCCFPANVQPLFFIHVGAIVCVCVCVTAWREESSSVESRQRETRPSLRKVRPGRTLNASQEAETWGRHCSSTFSCFLGLLPVWDIVFLFPPQRPLRSCGTSAQPSTTSTASTSPTETSRCREDETASPVGLTGGSFAHLSSLLCLLTSQRTCCTHWKKETPSSN